ncbi:MAG: hypothetical protein ACFFC1_13335 [Promethearchaeota archaeon]
MLSNSRTKRHGHLDRPSTEIIYNLSAREWRDLKEQISRLHPGQPVRWQTDKSGFIVTGTPLEMTVISAMKKIIHYYNILGTKELIKPFSITEIQFMNDNI